MTAVTDVIAPAAALDIAARTDRGMLRSLNEDSIAVDAPSGLLVLADGMGGYKAGDVASGIVTRTVVDVVARGLREDPSAHVAALLQRAVKIANGVVYIEGQRRAPGGKAARAGEDQAIGSTVAALVYRDGRVTIAHVGDSRVYRVRDRKLDLLTHDHTVLQEQVDLGMLSVDDAGHSHNRHLVTRGLGLQATVTVTLTDTSALPGDVYLLCSDGLNDLVDNADIELVINSLQANLPLAASQLVMIANDNGGDDNISVILAKVRPEGGAPRPRKGFFGRLFGF